MKVLMFGWEFPPHISGGLGTACHGLTTALLGHDIDVTFVLPRLRTEQQQGSLRLVGANRVSVRNVKTSAGQLRKTIKEIGVDSPLVPYVSPSLYKKLVKDLESRPGTTDTTEGTLETDLTGDYGPNMMDEVVRYSAVARALAASENFDVIHAHDWMTYLAGVEARNVSGKPLVAHIHATEFDRSGEHVNQSVYDIERWGLSQADKVIAVSHYTKDLVSSRYGVPEDRIQVVYNAVSQERRVQQLGISKPLREKVVLFLGRITFQKGPDYFLEAARKVLQKYRNVRFVMAGSGDMYHKMVERMASLRIGDHFHFTGFLRGTDVEKMYAMSDLYVMPSVSEPFGIAPLEAMVYNVPIIVSKQSGVAEVLPNAIKVDFWDTDKLAERILAVLTRPGLAKHMVENSAEQLRELKWERAAQHVIDVYRELGAQ